MTPRCWMSNVEVARLAHGEGSPRHEAALDRPSTCLLPKWHEGPHDFTFDGDITVTFGRQQGQQVDADRNCTRTTEQEG